MSFKLVAKDSDPAKASEAKRVPFIPSLQGRSSTVPHIVKITSSVIYFAPYSVIRREAAPRERGQGRVQEGGQDNRAERQVQAPHRVLQVHGRSRGHDTRRGHPRPEEQECHQEGEAEEEEGGGGEEEGGGEGGEIMCRDAKREHAKASEARRAPFILSLQSWRSSNFSKAQAKLVAATPPPLPNLSWWTRISGSRR